MNSKNNVISNTLHSSNWNKNGQSAEGETKITSKLQIWCTTFRRSRFLQKITRLWRLFRNGTLSGFEKALVLSALLYCVIPMDVLPDTIPLIGYLDDFALVLGALAFLDRKTE